MAQKGTAPSFFNQESDRDKPGSLSPLSEKGYDHIEALTPRETDTDDETRRKLSVRKIGHAITHLRRLDSDFYAAVLRVQNDPGLVRRWEIGSEPKSARWLRLYGNALQEATDFIEAVWPGTRLYVPLRVEEEEQKTLIHARNADNNRARSERAREEYREIAREIRAIRRSEGVGTDAAIELHRERLARANRSDVSPRTCYRALSLTLGNPDDEVGEEGAAV